jgi:hypothetical protein
MNKSSKAFNYVNWQINESVIFKISEIGQNPKSGKDVCPSYASLFFFGCIPRPYQCQLYYKNAEKCFTLMVWAKKIRQRDKYSFEIFQNHWLLGRAPYALTIKIGEKFANNYRIPENETEFYFKLFERFAKVIHLRKKKPRVMGFENSILR